MKKNCAGAIVIKGGYMLSGILMVHYFVINRQSAEKCKK